MREPGPLDSPTLGTAPGQVDLEFILSFLTFASENSREPLPPPPQGDNWKL